MVPTNLNPHAAFAAVACLLLIAGGFETVAQIVSYRDRNVVDYQDYLKYSKEVTGGQKAGVDYAGTPYQTDEFQDGVIYIDKKSKSSAIPMRYNIYRDEMEFKRGNYTYVLEPALSIDWVTVGDRAFILGEYVEGVKYRLGFFEVLDTGRVNLMMKQIVRLRQGQAPKAMESAATPPTYMKLGFDYYYQFGDGEVMKINSVKDFVGNLPAHNEEMGEFVKKNKIKKKEEDLVKLVRHYNSLE